jgi:hypothetical protein
MKFRFLSDHYINDRIYSAGEIVEMPSDWIPSNMCEPLDSEAVEAFWRAGPQQLGGVRLQWKPTTYWVSAVTPGSSARRWTLTGLGANQPAICM